VISFDGKVVLVTGAARGQGRSHCLRYAELGADVIALDLCADIDTVPYPLATPDDLAETAGEVEKLGRRVFAGQVDVRDHAALSAATEQAVAELGRLDIAIVNAGIAPLELDPAAPLQTWRDVIDVNLTGAYYTATIAARELITGGRGGSIVFINSTAGLKGGLALGTVGGFAYASAKHGLVGLARAFAIDLAPHSIRVNTLHPGGVNTPMVVNDSMEELKAARDLSAWTNLLPVGRIEVEDMSNAVTWITSDEARYITGASLPIDAGFSIK
jgi:SDR family mycofactocin-dependent oxidoreductase